MRTYSYTDDRNPETWGPAGQKPGEGWVRPEGDTCEIPARRLERCGPVNESALTRWRRSGWLQQEHEQAANEIAWVYGVHTAALDASAQNFDPERAGASNGNLEPSERFLGASQRYRTWADRMAVKSKASARPLFSVVIDIVALDKGARETERNYSMKSGASAEIVKEALDLYVELSGWRAV